jgi:hypothetical protein
MKIAFVYDDERVFIQVGLSEAVLDFVKGQIRRLHHFLYSGG